MMPIDLEPVPEGSLRLERINNGDAQPPRVVIVPRAYRVEGEPLFTPHWATCPFADQHRKR
jgi:hypothetical protein